MKRETRAEQQGAARFMCAAAAIGDILDAVRPQAGGAAHISGGVPVAPEP